MLELILAGLFIITCLIIYELGKRRQEALVANRIYPGETLMRADLHPTGLIIRPDEQIGFRPLQYHDKMRELEFAAEKEIAGCNSPPPVMQLLYG